MESILLWSQSRYRRHGTSITRLESSKFEGELLQLVHLSFPLFAPLTHQSTPIPRPPNPNRQWPLARRRTTAPRRSPCYASALSPRAPTVSSLMFAGRERERCVDFDSADFIFSPACQRLRCPLLDLPLLFLTFFLFLRKKKKKSPQPAPSAAASSRRPRTPPLPAPTTAASPPRRPSPGASRRPRTRSRAARARAGVASRSGTLSPKTPGTSQTTFTTSTPRTLP